MLSGRIDRFRCMHIKNIPDNLGEQIEASIGEWRSQVKAVWIEIPNTRLDLIPVCGSYGFCPHHVSSTGVMMALWLSNRPNTLPTYSTHYVGAGGLVFHGNNVLMVKELSSLTGSMIWKLPGGLVNHDESIYEGVAREVKEETSIDATVLGIIGFRERNKYQFGRGDMYFILLMDAINTEILPDGHEVKEAQWMDFYEWLNIPESSETRMMVKTALGNSEKPPREALLEKVFHLQTRELNNGTYINTHRLFNSPIN